MLTPGKSLMNTRREKERESRRNDILDVAEQVFRRKGYHLATTEEIARDSGFSVGTLYNFFTDKEGLYAAVLDRLGHQLLARLENTVLRQRQASAALEELIKLRLYNHVRDRLFFQAFSSEGQLGIQPDPASLPRSIAALYEKYTRYVEGIFARALDQAKLTGLDPMHLVLSMEAMVNVYMGYWTRAGRAASVESTAAHIAEILLSPVMLQRIGNLSAEERSLSAEAREIKISRFDLDRLKELITVARCFGKPEDTVYLNELEMRLRGAKEVNPQEVPPDLVTMNSIVRLHELESGREIVCALVFPIDAESKEENVSILSPLGTALLGNRCGDVFEVKAKPSAKRFRVQALTYQPEAAGDFHR